MDHRGKGPKNYARTDERIKEDVSEALYRSSEVDASEIEVLVENGFVILRGEVPDRFQKKTAEACAEAVSGVKDVINQLTFPRPTGLVNDMNLRANFI